MKIVMFYTNWDRGRPIEIALTEAGHSVDANPLLIRTTLLTLDEYDLAVVAGSDYILTEKEIAKPKFGTVNCHAGKLPEYRGGSPLNWALINGEKRIHQCLIQMDSGIDTGDILYEASFKPGKNDTIDDLHEMVNKAFPQMVLMAVEELEECGHMQARPQLIKGGVARYWPQRTAADSEITLDMPPAQVYNKVRACREPYPAFIRLGKHSYKMELQK